MTQYLVKNQLIGSITPHPFTILPTKITASNVLGVVTAQKDVQFTDVGGGITVATAWSPDSPYSAPDDGKHGLTRYEYWPFSGSGKVGPHSSIVLTT